MAISIFDLFSIGIGPSSSHTVGPMKAARSFVEDLRGQGLLGRTTAVKAELYGSLGATGKGHGSDKAVMLGLAGETPENVDTDGVSAWLDDVRQSGILKILGEHPVCFNEKQHLVLHRRKALPFHPNGMRFTALADGGEVLTTAVYYSVGGGFVVDESATDGSWIGQDTTAQPYPFTTGAELLRLCNDNDLSISALMLENEKVWRSEAAIRDGLLNIWSTMQECVDNGCRHDGILPGGMKVKRRGQPLRPRGKRGKRRRRPRRNRAHQRRRRHHPGSPALLPLAPSERRRRRCGAVSADRRRHRPALQRERFHQRRRGGLSG
jgi:L-serine dehydratase